MTSFPTLLARAPLLTDGAWGTQLQGAATPGACLEYLNVLDPGAVAAVARSYVDAGSDIILTNTFGANRIALARHGLAERAIELNRAGAALSLRAAGVDALVFGSMGPSAKMLFLGETTEADLKAAFDEQADALAEAGVAALLVETMTEADEAVAAVRAAARTGLPVIASMVFDSGPGRDHTMMGVSIADAARRLEKAGAAGVGANCGIGIDGAEFLVAQFRAASSLPVWIKPNAGLPELEAAGSIVYRITPEEYARHVPALAAAGATFIGGCCGTTPDFIRAMRAALGPRHAASSPA